MPTLYREPPPEFTETAANAEALHELAWQTGPEKGTPNTSRIQIFAGLLTIVFEHHDSTVILLKTARNDASGFALARLLVETFYRGMWSLGCASEAQVEEIRAGDRPYPHFIEMTKAVDRAYGKTGRLEMDKEIWAALCGLTHSGAEQLFRRFDPEGNLRPNYSLDEVLQMMISGTKFLSTMSQAFCVAAGRKEDARLIDKFFKDLFESK